MCPRPPIRGRDREGGEGPTPCVGHTRRSPTLSFSAPQPPADKREGLLLYDHQ